MARFLIKSLLFTIAFQLMGCGSILSDNHQTIVPSYKPRSIILFVHGLSGDGEGTWKDSNNKFTWIEMFNGEKDFIDLALFSKAYNYESGFFKKGDSLHDMSGNLISELKRLQMEGVDNIYIISHSMGGLIVASALNRIEAESSELFNKIKCVLFIAVPFKGINLNPLIRRFLFSKQIIDLYRRESTSFLPDLNYKMQLIRDNRIMQNRKYPIFYNYYEKKRSYLFFHIVPEPFTLQHADEIIGVNKNHKTIARPSYEDDIYKWSKNNIIVIEKELSQESFVDDYFEVYCNEERLVSSTTTIIMHPGRTVLTIRLKNITPKTIDNVTLSFATPNIPEFNIDEQRFWTRHTSGGNVVMQYEYEAPFSINPDISANSAPFYIDTVTTELPKGYVAAVISFSARDHKLIQKGLRLHFVNNEK